MKTLRPGFWLLMLATAVACAGVAYFRLTGAYYSPSNWLANVTGFVACAGLAGVVTTLAVGSYRRD